MDFDGGDGDLEDDGDKDNDDLHRVERWEGVRAASLVDKRHLETTWIIIDLIDGNHDDDDGGDEYHHIVNCDGEEVKDNKKVSNRGRVFLGSENLQCWDQVKKIINCYCLGGFQPICKRICSENVVHVHNQRWYCLCRS